MARRTKRKVPEVWRIGILSGTGTARKRTVPALLGSDICRVTFVHGRSDVQLRRIAAVDPEIHLVSSEHEFAELRDCYDIIYVGSPPFLRLSQIRLAVQLGMPVICEKPLVMRREDLGPVMVLLEDSDIPFMVAHHVRHQPAVRDIMGVLESSRLGSPVAASLQWCFLMDHGASSARWKLDPIRGGSNAMFDSGVHALDLAVQLFGPPERVSAVGHNIRSPDTLDSVVALLDYTNFCATITASQSGSPEGNDLLITFPSSVLRASNLLGESSAREVEISGLGAERLTYEPINLYQAEVENFCRSLDDHNSAGTPLTDAAIASRILFAIEDAIRVGSLVDVDMFG
jgi:predicted dehydrogenase